MKECVFDIETAGYEWDSIDEGIKDILIDKFDSIENAKMQLGLNPLISKIIVISMLDISSRKIYTFMEPVERNLFEGDSQKELDGDYEIIIRTGDERTILEYFCEEITKYKKYITFNGRHFDIPFIIYRSMYHRLKPTRKLMTNRYYADTHFDIYDMLTFYGAAYGHSLEMWCRTMGITNPKEQGISGANVGKYYREGRIKEIAQYCNRDVIATAQLYDRIKDYF